MIKHCLKLEVGERARSAAELLQNQALSSLAAQLKNGVLPGNLVFGKNQSETTEMIYEKVNHKNKQLKEINSELKHENFRLKNENQKIIQEKKIEIAEIEKMFVENMIKFGFGHFTAKRDGRSLFNEEDVRRVLRGLEAGLTKVNFKLWIQTAFYICFCFDRFYPIRSLEMIQILK